MKKQLGIYLHIPFCVRKCAYCDFLSAPADRQVREAYVRALEEEIRDFADADSYEVRSVFIGGGTPSCLEEGQIFRLMEAVRGRFAVREDAEISIECNPGTLDEGKLQEYKSAGTNRLSIGMQSADDQELALLGRIHTRADLEKSFALARKAGFDNINIDLISGLPGQKPEDFARSLKAVCALSPEHISAYSLIIEEGTPFGAAYGEDDLRRQRGLAPKLLPTEEEERKMSADTVRILADAGYARYEISNYALPGRECVHNTGYWIREPYAGFGIGAASLLGNERTKNTTDLAAYIAGDRKKEERQSLSLEEEMSETMFLGLRLIRGVDLARFEETFGVSAMERWKEEIARMEAEGLLADDGKFLSLTERGLDIANYVMAQFV